MEDKLEVEQLRLTLLADARSALWTLKQLTSAESARRYIACTNYLYELHQIAARGIAVVDHVIDDIECFDEAARTARPTKKSL